MRTLMITTTKPLNQMNKNRRRKHEKHPFLKRNWQRATNYVLSWVYQDTAFERLNPEE
jgi:hypothetical protein